MIKVWTTISSQPDEHPEGKSAAEFDGGHLRVTAPAGSATKTLAIYAPGIWLKTLRED